LTNEVAKTSAAYDAMAEGWELPRALMGGTRGMRAADKKYLPQEPGESSAAYENRLNRSTLFNAFRRTVNGIVGKVFSKPITLQDDVPSDVASWCEDVDLAGRRLDVFASDVFGDGVQTGISHILVTMPADEPPSTLAEERQRGRRPYFVHIRAEDMIGWRSETIGGKETLTQIRFRECVTEPAGEYGEKVLDRIRVLWRDRFELWQKDDKGDWQLIGSGPVTLGEIPLATFYAARTGFMTAEPPLEDLAHLNVAHWQSSSDQRHILHFARVPLLFGTALDTEEGKSIEIGPNRLIKAQDPNGKLMFVEHSGASIGAGRQDLVDIEERMRVLGLELMVNMPGNQTATGKSIDTAQQNSAVKRMALSLQDALEQALVFMARWKELGDNGGSLQVNTDFGLTLQGSAEVQELLNARMAGEISRETFWAEMKRRGLLMDDFDPEAEQLRLDEEGSVEDNSEVDPELARAA
jgi:hypothetical protein